MSVKYWKNIAVIFFGCIIAIVFSKHLSCEVQRFEIVGNNSNLVIYIRPKRMTRGVYSVMANITTKEDLDNDYTFEVAVSRSAYGTNQYIKLPFYSALGALNLENFANILYKPFMMKSLKTCANSSLQFEKPFKPPLPAGFYLFDSCLIKDEAFPQYLLPGLYRGDLFVRKKKTYLAASIYMRLY